MEKRTQTPYSESLQGKENFLSRRHMYHTEATVTGLFLTGLLRISLCI